MNATLSFQLPDERDEHKAALEGVEWKSVARLLDQVLRDQLKHGHKFETPSDALQATRDKLHELVGEADLILWS